MALIQAPAHAFPVSRQRTVVAAVLTCTDTHKTAHDRL
ncbi:hypothetical protein SAMN04515671_1652 [Nakamurella panacisegetis]|uniref:Uncharacterized protein n=1 Tax=Nakamurella panacisegetis TaxID=1090615 RepID=A0A1H0LG25_9ACTN|nr:hypothetical protein SAMN04515671_1652 [Nakamurella panacisegetis]